MNDICQEESVVEDESTFTQFVSIGEISQALYLAMHPEEDDDLP